MSETSTASVVGPRRHRWRWFVAWVVLVAGIAVVARPVIGEAPQMLAAVRRANPWWGAVAALLASGGFFAAAASLRACSPRALPFVRTVRVQLASAFTGTATPASVGSLALNVRYLTAQGFDPALATGTVALQAVVQTLTHLVLLGLLTWLGASTVSLHGPSWSRWVLLVVAVVVVATALAFVTWPRLRHGVVRRVRTDVLPAARRLGTLLVSPRRLLLAVAGAGGTTIASAATMWAALLAFGEPSRPVAAAFTTMVGGTLASAAPTPGGLGAVEAALIAGLVGFGVPPATAVPAVLFYRVLSTWLPVLAGSFQLRALRRAHVV